MKTLKRLSSLLLAVILVSGCGQSVKYTSYQDLLDRGSIVIGVDDTFAPMGFRDENGELTGFDIDLARLVGEQIGLKATFQPIDWSMKESELNAGNIDLIWNGYSITDKRKKIVNYSDAYLENRQVIVVLSSSEINTKNDLVGKEINVQKESSAYEAVTSDEEFYNSLKNLIEFDNYIDCFMDLEASRTQAIVVDEVLARYIIAKRGQANYRILEDNFGTEEYGIGVVKGNDELREKINEALDLLKDNGQYDALCSKWFD